EVERIDSLVRENRMLPLHDTSAAQSLVRERMARLAEDAARLGERGEGPRRYALGVGELALGSYQGAVDHLTAAWAAGHRSGDVAGALGEAMARLFLQRREAAARVRNPDHRDQVLEELDLELRRPAIARLEQGRGEAVDARLVREALVALLEGRHDDALRLARDSERRFPWRYEALMLQAEIVLERGLRAEEAGELELAAADHVIAGEVLARALEIGRSDPLVYEAEARRLARRIAVRGDMEATGQDAQLERALELADAARTAAPWRAEPWNLLARLRWLRADALLRSGNDPVEELELALEHALRAVELAPTDVEAIVNRSMIHRARATFEAQSGRDPRPWLEQSARASREALAVDPDSASAFANLGIARYLAAEHELALGLEPEPALEEAATALAESLRVRPSFAVYNNLGLIHWQWASAVVQRGGDPSSHLDRASECYAAAMALNSSHPHPPSNLGLVLLELADLAAERGDDPEPWVERAVAALEASVERAPGFMEALNNLGNAHKARGEVRLARGEDPTASLGRAVEEYQRAIAANPRPAFLYSNLGFAHVLQAEYRLLTGADPAAPLASAREAFSAALERDPKLAVAHHNVSHAWLVEARRQMVSGGDPMAAVERARRAAARSVAQNAGLFSLRLGQAAVEIEAARWLVARGRDPGRELAAGGAALTTAASLNPASPVADRMAADLAGLRATWLLSTNGDPAAELRAGLELIARASESGGEQAETLLVEARLAALSARTGSEAAGPEPVRRAHAALDRAIQLNPLLERRCAEIRRQLPPS
ncbi:MAG TPA: hypothetical protein VLA75_01750, partial [Thermoanaerobaculia bacterium]|nr:hypothetical protein [Thermoanaerobaculia bacterium]